MCEEECPMCHQRFKKKIMHHLLYKHDLSWEIADKIRDYTIKLSWRHTPEQEIEWKREIAKILDLPRTR